MFLKAICVYLAETAVSLHKYFSTAPLSSPASFLPRSLGLTGIEISLKRLAVPERWSYRTALRSVTGNTHN